MIYKKRAEKPLFHKGLFGFFGLLGLFFLKRAKRAASFWALFSKKSVLAPFFQKKPTIANGFVPSGQTYKWII